MNRINHFLNKIEEIFVSTAILITCFILFINVVTRHYGYSINWAEEFTRYMMVWVTFIGGSICVRNNLHVGIDAFVMRLSDKAQSFVHLIVSFIGLLFVFVMTILGFQLVSQVMGWGQLTPAMMIPMWIPYLGIPIGCFLMTIRYLQSFIKNLNNIFA